MQRDIRRTAEYREAEVLYESLRRPGSGQICDAAEAHVSPAGDRAFFTGTLVETLASTPSTRICQIDMKSGDVRVLTFGPNSDRLPKCCPRGNVVAFLSDRGKVRSFQLYLLDLERRAVRPAGIVDGWVEYFHWSPDGQRVLLGVAGHGADISGGQGAVSSLRESDDSPSWMPSVDVGDEQYRWRSVWIYDLADGRIRRVSRDGMNIWEAAWCGADTIAAVVSPGPSEGLWYGASLHSIHVDGGHSRRIYQPADQLGWTAGSPSGARVAVVEATCSDRWVVAGDLRVIEMDGGTVRRIECGFDVTYTEWRSDRSLLLAGHRGHHTVVGVLDVESDQFREVWSNCELTTGIRYPAVAGLNDSGDCVLIGESFQRAPEIAVLRSGKYVTVKSFDLDDEGRGERSNRSSV